jgi:hypothetical protein
LEAAILEGTQPRNKALLTAIATPLAATLFTTAFIDISPNLKTVSRKNQYNKLTGRHNNRELCELI